MTAIAVVVPRLRPTIPGCEVGFRHEVDLRLLAALPRLPEPAMLLPIQNSHPKLRRREKQKVKVRLEPQMSSAVIVFASVAHRYLVPTQELTAQ